MIQIVKALLRGLLGGYARAELGLNMGLHVDKNSNYKQQTKTHTTNFLCFRTVCQFLREMPSMRRRRKGPSLVIYSFWWAESACKCRQASCLPHFTTTTQYWRRIRGSSRESRGFDAFDDSGASSRHTRNLGSRMQTHGKWCKNILVSQQSYIDTRQAGIILGETARNRVNKQVTEIGRRTAA